jgi:hypothetical protein
LIGEVVQYREIGSTGFDFVENPKAAAASELSAPVKVAVRMFD